MSERDLKTGQFKKTHGLTKSRLYGIWSGMKDRCKNPAKASYEHYGGRGISVCEEWKNDFMAFYEWALANGYEENLSIDRIDVNGNYEPSNCRWVDDLTQDSNKTNNKYVEIDGIKYTVPQLERKYGINRNALYARARKLGYVKEILNERNKKIQYKGQFYSKTALAKKLGLSIQCLTYRINAGWNEDDLIKPIDTSKYSKKAYEIAGEKYPG